MMMVVLFPGNIEAPPGDQQDPIPATTERSTTRTIGRRVPECGSLEEGIKGALDLHRQCGPVASV
jgi:hypothetical protein